MRTDRHNEADCRFLQFSKCAQNISSEEVVMGDIKRYQSDPHRHTAAEISPVSFRQNPVSTAPKENAYSGASALDAGGRSGLTHRPFFNRKSLDVPII
jgi:hypothetical protein